MKKPEKKDTQQILKEDRYFRDMYEVNSFLKAYNECCDNWEKFLPSEGEIKKIILDNVNLLLQVNSKKLAKAIYKRLGGEK